LAGDERGEPARVLPVEEIQMPGVATDEDAKWLGLLS
jgi:hypothetical protein